MNNDIWKQDTVKHAITLIESFLSRLTIGRFEGPQSNSGYREYSDNIYYTKTKVGNKIQYSVGEWMLQTADMYGWEWRVTFVIDTNFDDTPMILSRIDCLGNVTDILTIDNAKLNSITSIDETITVLLLQGAHTDHISDLTDRGFVTTIPDASSPNKSPWSGLQRVNPVMLAVNAITLTEPEGIYGIRTSGITKSFSTNDGYVNKFWLFSTPCQTYLTICGMGFSYTLSQQEPLTLDMVDTSFKRFFTAIMSDWLSASSHGRNMAKIYQNNLIVLGGLRYVAKPIHDLDEVSSVFGYLSDRAKEVCGKQPTRLKFQRNRIGTPDCIIYYPEEGYPTKPLRLWMTYISKNVTNVGQTNFSSIFVESIDTPQINFSLFLDDIDHVQNAVELLTLIQERLRGHEQTASAALMDDMIMVFNN